MPRILTHPRVAPRRGGRDGTGGYAPRAVSRPSTKPVSGMKDHLPGAALRRRAAVRRIEDAFATHGFVPLETPAMERLSTLLGKYGEEGDRLIYRILHRGARLDRALGREAPGPTDLADLGLRYDLTVPLARVAAQYRGKLPSVFRRYQIQPVWRADRAQRGRLREFTQCDADIVGSRSPVADAETVACLHAALRALGFRGFTILLNHRELLRGLTAACGIPGSAEEPTLVALDKLDKIGASGVRRELEKLPEVGARRASRLLELVAPPGEDAGEWSPDPALERVAEQLAPGPGRTAAAELRDLLDLLGDALGADRDAVRFAPGLARGLSYYTGPIFEVVAAGGAGSLAGGGRYDGLVGMFGGRDIPAVGFSLGLERLLLLLEETGGDASPPAGPTARLCPLRGVTAGEVLKVARRLRAAGVHLEVAMKPRPLGRHLARAAAAGLPFALVLGPDEAAAGACTVRNLTTRTQQTAPLPEVPTLLSD